MKPENEAAAAREKGFDFKESLLSPDEQSELNALRRLQIEAGLSSDQRRRFLELSGKEEAARERNLLK